MVVVDVAANGEGVRRGHADVAVLVAEVDRLEHLDRAPGGALLDDAGALDEKDERGGAPVHDGDLLAVQLDHRVVDPAAGEGGPSGGSMVRTETWPLPIAVQSLASTTFPWTASIVRREPAGWSVRQNTMPVPGGAGRNSMRTLRLLWTPIPAQ